MNKTIPQDHLDEIEEKISQAIQSARDAGWIIVQGSWIQRIHFQKPEGEISKDSCKICALSTLILDKLNNHSLYVELVANILGVDKDFVSDFIMGFDDQELDNQVIYKQAYDLGQSFNKLI